MEKALETLDFDLWEHDEERLVELVVLLFRKSGLMESFKIDEERLRAFVIAVRDGYRSNPFHNFRHGFDVLQVVSALTSGLALRQLRPLELLAMFLTSLCVDLDHGGVSDLFLVNTQSPLAQVRSSKLTVAAPHYPSHTNYIPCYCWLSSTTTSPSTRTTTAPASGRCSRSRS